MTALRAWSQAEGIRAPRSDDALLDALANAIEAGRIKIVPRKRRTGGMPGADVFTEAKKDSDTPARQPAEAPPREEIKIRERPSQPAADTQPETPGSTAPPATVPEPAQKTWIEFCLLDDETGDPLPDIPIRITLTDGSEQQQTTDAAGLVRIDGIDPGQCNILEIVAENGPEVTEVD